MIKGFCRSGAIYIASFKGAVGLVTMHKRQRPWTDPGLQAHPKAMRTMPPAPTVVSAADSVPATCRQWPYRKMHHDEETNMPGPCRAQPDSSGTRKHAECSANVSQGRRQCTLNLRWS